mmetsp:Transcript_24166/g.27586  ORF Transcript_24166/g.27586 Transcript_24166/m.27586 type:complete len:207 (+) Transcript_24166:106-726(+)
MSHITMKKTITKILVCIICTICNADSNINMTKQNQPQEGGGSVPENRRLRNTHLIKNLLDSSHNLSLKGTTNTKNNPRRKEQYMLWTKGKGKGKGHYWYYSENPTPAPEPVIPTPAPVAVIPTPAPVDDPFDLQVCSTYYTQWLIELHSSCDESPSIDDFDDGCQCSDAQRRIDEGQIDCENVECPFDCEICTTCIFYVTSCRESE